MKNDKITYTSECAKTLTNALTQISEGMTLLSSGPSSFYIERVGEYIEALFGRFAPFKPGDRVILTRTPEITKEKSWGWLGAKHFLVAGRKGTIRSVDYNNGKFTALVAFDNETYINPIDNKEKPVDSPSLYGFTEDDLRIIVE